MESRVQKFRVGAVPYANAFPLVAWFEVLGRSSPVEVIYDVPSALPSLLESREVDAILVSSIEALRTPGMRMASSLGIASDGEVRSVRLFSQVPFSEIKSLAWDQSSLTSNRLAMIALDALHSVRPRVVVRQPSLKDMLKEVDAAILIGDVGMDATADGLHVLDLGSAWTQLTGLPFLWAGWLGFDRLTPELAMLLAISASFTPVGKQPSGSQLTSSMLRRWTQGSLSPHQPHLDTLIEFAIQRTGWSREKLLDYYGECIVYDLTESVMSGYREFQTRLLSLGYTECALFPAMVSGATADIALMNALLQEARSEV